MFNLINVDNLDSINSIKNAINILTDAIMDIQNHLSEIKTIKPNSNIPYKIQFLIKQNQKIKREYIKRRNTFLKSALTAISKRIKKAHKKAPECSY